ncbi:MAG: tetratricopeptide repeat protein, partial [Leptospira sp.]|nr:tetratricopeptide repeat protein [Leptospira sp.]
MYQKISRVNFYLILSLFIAIIEISPGDISEDLRAGEENFKKRDYKSALRNYKSAISINPSSKKALLGFAKSSVVIGSKDDAKEAFQKLLSIDPKNKEAALGLIGLLTNERKFDEALKLISIHLEDDKYNPDLLASEADIYLRMGKKKELALKKLEEISSKIAGNVKFSVSLALANSMNGRTQRAQVILDKLISEYPDNPIPFLEKAKLNLQIAKSQSGDQVTKLVNEALSLLQTALSLDSQNPEARVFIVNVFLWLENFEEAARIQSSLIKDFPFTPEFRYMNAFLSEKTGKTEIAEMDYKKLLELNELDELGRFAAEDFALRSLKENSPLRSKLGEYRLEEFKKGERNFIYRDSGFNIFRASKLIPENNQLKRERLEYYLKRGYIKDFISVLIKLKKDNPDDFKLHNRLENVLKKFREGLSFKEGLEVISRSGIKENYERNPPEIFIFDLTSGNFPGSHPNASSLISGAINFYLRLMPEIKIISGKEEDAIRNDIMTKKGAEKYTGGINYSPDIVSSLDIMRQSGMPVRYLG